MDTTVAPPPTQDDAESGESSIISEVVPTDIGAASELHDEQGAAYGRAGAALPLIGTRPLAEQQRILGALVLAGVVGLVVMAGVSMNSASKSAAQVGASGQALMQSQRLAKSVSQAMVGNAKAFPEVRESAEVLVSTLHRPEGRRRPDPAAPPRCRRRSIR